MHDLTDRLNRVGPFPDPSPDRLQVPLYGGIKSRNATFDKAIGPSGVQNPSDPPFGRKGGLLGGLKTREGVCMPKGRSFTRVPSLLVRLLYTPRRVSLSGSIVIFFQAVPGLRDAGHDPDERASLYAILKPLRLQGLSFSPGRFTSSSGCGRNARINIGIARDSHSAAPPLPRQAPGQAIQ